MPRTAESFPHHFVSKGFFHAGFFGFSHLFSVFSAPFVQFSYNFLYAFFIKYPLIPQNALTLFGQYDMITLRNAVF